MDVYSNYSLSLPVEHRSIETSCHLLFWVNFSISFQGVAYLWPLIVRGSPLWGDVLLTQDWCDFVHASYGVFVISFIHLVGDWPVSGFWVGLHSYRSGPGKQVYRRTLPRTVASTYLFLATATWTRDWTVINDHFFIWLWSVWNELIFEEIFCVWLTDEIRQDMEDVIARMKPW